VHKVHRACYSLRLGRLSLATVPRHRIRSRLRRSPAEKVRKPLSRLPPSSVQSRSRDAKVQNKDGSKDCREPPHAILKLSSLSSSPFCTPRLISAHENTHHPQPFRNSQSATCNLQPRIQTSPTDTPAPLDGRARPSTAIPMIPCIGDALALHLRFVPSTRRFLNSLHHVSLQPTKPASSPVPVWPLPPNSKPKQPPEAFFQHPREQIAPPDRFNHLKRGSIARHHV
jgi:hypothetical protein